MPDPGLPRPASALRVLGILLLSGSFERAHAALVMTVGAAAIDRPVVLFATNSGLHALCRDWSGLAGSEADKVFRERGVVGFATLQEMLAPLGVRLMGCETGLRAMALLPEALLDGIEVVGVPSFLSAVGDGQMLSI